MTRIGHLTKSSLCAAYKYTGAARAHEVLARRVGQQFMAILVFHRVTDQIPPDGLTVGTVHFERICRLLRRSFNVVPLGQVFKVVRTGTPMPPRTVAITFDDSYRDNLFAARVLARHGLPATFFIPTGFVGTDHVYHWDEHLPRMPNLTWADVREIRDLGFEVGSHTVTHPNLGKVTFNQARTELIESKRTLEEQLRQPVRWFAYPFGGVKDLRPEQVEYLGEAGYDGCVSAYGGLVYPGADPRVLPRTPVPPFRSLVHLELHLRGCLNWIHSLKRRLGWIDPPDPSNPAAEHSLSFAARKVCREV